MRLTGKDRLNKYSSGTDKGGVKPTAKDIEKKYSKNPYVKGRGFWGEYLDENLPISKSKVRDVIYKVSKQTGINPALLYSSAMEEGLQLYKTKPQDTSTAYYNWAAKNKDLANKFQVDGFFNYGLDTFGDVFPRLVKKGYLGEDYKDQFTTYQALNDNKKNPQKVNTAAFASDEAALLAKAAMLKDADDELGKHLTKNKITLSDKARQFFTLAAYNSGIGGAQDMIKSYQTKGYLKDDKWLDPTFKPASYSGVYENVQKRLQNKDVMETEGFFSDYQNDNAVAKKYESGGLVDGLASFLPSILQMIDGMGGNQTPSKQPLVNASTMRNMVSPYGFGGEVDEDTLAQLQELADAQGISVEELMMQFQGEETEDDIEEYSDDEEYIDEEYADEEEEYGEGGMVKPVVNKKTTSNPIVSPKKVKVKPVVIPTYTPSTGGGGAATIFNAMGGTIGGNIPIEVEGEEVIETPDGEVGQVKGPSHEEGGVNMTVPAGTKIFSDRIQIDGKTMQERKKGRERGMARLEKLRSKNPSDNLLKATIQRTNEKYQKQEAEDMELQEALRAVQNQQFADGTGPSGVTPYMFSDVLDSIMNPKKRNTTIPYAPGTEPIVADKQMSTVTPTINPTTATTKNIAPTTPSAPKITKKMMYGENPDEDALGIGDYVGLAGNLFNAIAPMQNTIDAAANSKPNINRFRGFGRKALETNDEAQDVASRTLANKKSEIATSFNSAIKRGRNSASSVNTSRVLDTVATMGANKAQAAAEDAFSSNLINLLGNRGNIEMKKDQMEMSGEERRDIADKQDLDNYYSNMAQNLTNFGSNVQGIGKALNVARQNKVNKNLLSQLSKHGLSFDSKGNLISKKK